MRPQHWDPIQQTAPLAVSLSDCVTVTLPIHPLLGTRLPVVPMIRSRGRRYVDAEHPGGWAKPRAAAPRAQLEVELSGTADLDESDYADTPSPEW